MNSGDKYKDEYWGELPGFSRYEEVNKEENENIPKESEEIKPIKEKKKNNLRVSFKSIKAPTNMSKSLKKEIDLNAIQLSMIYSKDFTTEGKLLPSLYDMLAQPSNYKLGLKKIEMPGIELITSQERRIDVPVVNRILQKRKEVIRAVRALNEVEKITVILITHYMEEAVQADYIYVMEKGKVIMDGRPREIFARVDELKEHRLDVPQITELAYELKKAGVPMPECVLTRREFVTAIKEASGK